MNSEILKKIRESENSQVLENEFTVVMNKSDGSKPLDSTDLKSQLEQPNWNKLESCFENLELIGVGGMATVYAAKDKLFYRQIALKIMRSELRGDRKYVNSFIKEARITAQIDHPNIVPVYNLGAFDDTGAYFSMKKVEGETLANVLKLLSQNNEVYLKKYSLRRRLEIFISICNGLSLAHSKGILHLDLKPGNIMLGNYGEVFIMDWGMAEYRSEKDKSTDAKKIELSQHNNTVYQKKDTIAGTPAFMAPEQINDKLNDIDERSDIYALGGILYSILSCQSSPFETKLDVQKTLKKVLTREIKPLHKFKKLQISRELEAICNKAMEFHSENRYQSVLDLMSDVRNFLDMQPVEVYNSCFLRFIKYYKRHPLVPTAFLGALVFSLIFFSYFFIKDIISFQNLKETVSYNLSNNEALLGNIILTKKQGNKNLHKNDEYFLWQNYEADLVYKLKLIKYKDTANFLLGKLAEMNSLSYKKEVSKDITLALKNILEFCIITNDGVFFQRILGLINSDFKREYNELLTNNFELRDQVNSLFYKNSLVKFNSKKPLIIKVLATPNEEMNNKVFNLNGNSFTKRFNEGLYVFEVSDEKNNKIIYPLNVKLGKKYDINLYVPSKIPKDMVFISKGEYMTNVDYQEALGAKRFIGDFFIKKQSVTFKEYLEFWKQLKSSQKKYNYIAKIIQQERYETQVKVLWDDEGNLLSPYSLDMPVVGISVEAAKEFCKYMSKKMNMPCRLPFYGEIDKAARGIDGRLYVWGNKFYPDYALISTNPLTKKYPYGALEKLFPKDCSIYGVYGLTGNVKELIQLDDKKTTLAYGGSFLSQMPSARCGYISNYEPFRYDNGFRYVIELKDKEQKKK